MSLHFGPSRKNQELVSNLGVSLFLLDFVSVIWLLCSSPSLKKTWGWISLSVSFGWITNHPKHDLKLFICWQFCGWAIWVGLLGWLSVSLAGLSHVSAVTGLPVVLSGDGGPSFRKLALAHSHGAVMVNCQSSQEQRREKPWYVSTLQASGNMLIVMN